MAFNRDIFTFYQRRYNAARCVYQTTASRGHLAPVPGNYRLTKPDLIGQTCDIIKLDLKQTGCEDVGCTRLAQLS
jgi:hypothetical protein